MTRRVVITGIGAVTPVGIGATEFWRNISAGCNGIGPITRFDTEGHKAKLAAEVKGFDPALYMDKKDARRSDLYCRYGIAASKLAVDDAGIDFAAMDASRVGVIIASGVGGLGTLEEQHSILVEKGPGRVSPFYIPMMISNMAAGMVSMMFGLKGPSYCLVSACASGAHALGEAFRAIRHGYMDACLAGGAEATVTPMALAGFANMTALSNAEDPDMASLPFDRRRAGFIMGEGAGVLMLEEYEAAVKRGAKIYAEIAGYGATSDAYHITSPDPDGRGAEAAMRLALQEAGLETVDYINAHGTGTPINDRIETLAVKNTFKTPPPVSSTKSMTGHLLGAAGGVESAICALAITHQTLPPTINYLEPDPECELDVVPNKARPAEINSALSNSLGFGGHNASLLFRRA